MDLLAHSDPAAGIAGFDLVPALVVLVGLRWARRPRDRAILLLTSIALAASALPPLHQIAERSVTGHMVQHLVLIVVAAPLLGLVVATAPTRLRRSPPLRWAASSVGHPLSPLLLGAVHAAVLVAWHVPVPYDAAVQSWVVHGAEHLTLVGSGAWWWAAVAHHGARRGLPGAVVSLFVVATAGAAMGVFMMFAPTAAYGQGGVADQQTAGALMAGATGALYAGTSLWLGARAITRFATPQPVRIPARGAATTLTVLACALAAATLGALTQRGSDGDDRASPSPADGPAAVGEHLYRRDCASCHGPDARGSFRGTPLVEVGTASVRYVLSTGRMPIPAPDAAVQRSEPAYAPDQVDALVAYLDTIIEGPSARPAAALDTTAATVDLPRGGERYRLHCAACHGAEGIGGALTVEGVTPAVLHASPTDVVDAMVAGPGSMPAFDTALDAEEMVDVAAYVQMLQDPPRTGLVTLPGGRVGEGLVAWLAGLGALIVASRWLGTRQ